MSKREINLNQLKVKDLMTTKVKTIDVSESLNTAARILWANRIHSVIVLKEGKLHKIITSLDIVNIVVESFTGNSDTINMPIDKFMQNQKLKSVTSGASLKEAIEILAELKISHLPVVDQDDLVGIISISDIIRYIGKKPSK